MLRLGHHHLHHWLLHHGLLHHLLHWHTLRVRRHHEHLLARHVLTCHHWLSWWKRMGLRLLYLRSRSYLLNRLLIVRGTVLSVIFWPVCLQRHYSNLCRGSYGLRGNRDQGMRRNWSNHLLLIIHLRLHHSDHCGRCINNHSLKRLILLSGYSLFFQLPFEMRSIASWSLAEASQLPCCLSRLPYHLPSHLASFKAESEGYHESYED